MSADAALRETLAARRRGWCPGALRPMATGDGLMARLRIIGGALEPKTARAIANLAEQYGNGHIDLTSRANLQIRGLSESGLEPLQFALDSLGLIDADPQAEAVRNVMASPLAGRDPGALLDIRPSVKELDRRLRSDPLLWRLPAKFGFLIDDSGCLSIAEESADVGFVASRSGGAICFSVRLAGRSAGFCGVESLVETAARLAAAFLDLRGSGENAARRMATVVNRFGVEPILSAAGLAPRVDANENGKKGGHPRVLGEHDLGRERALGVGAPFGRLDAMRLRRLADAAERVEGELRLTPWRAILIIGSAFDDRLVSSLRSAGLLIDEDDPIRAVAACPGMPACANASTATQSDAARLAPLARRLSPRGVALHVSGCSKGCAHAAAAPVILVGHGGKYDLMIDGRAGDTPTVRQIRTETLESLIETIATAPRNERAAAARAFAEIQK